MQKKCPKCGKNFILGVNGIIGGCDKCQGIIRDSEGLPWKPGEETQTYAPITTCLDPSTWIVVTRKQAFGE